MTSGAAVAVSTDVAGPMTAPIAVAGTAAITSPTREVQRTREPDERNLSPTPGRLAPEIPGHPAEIRVNIRIRLDLWAMTRV